MIRRRMVVTLLAVMLAACASARADRPFELTEFSISGPDVVSSGPSHIDLVNTGSFSHTLVITDQNGQVVAATGLIGPGESGSLDVDLDDGVYSFTCRIVVQNSEGELIDHFEAGMHTMVRATS